MTVFVVHNASGVISGFVQVPTATLREGEEGTVEQRVPGTPDGWEASEVEGDIRELARRALWFDVANGALVDSATITIEADRYEIVSDGQSAAVIGNLPDPCWLRINNDWDEASGGSWALTSDVPGEFIIRACWQHASQPITIVAMPLEAWKARKRGAVTKRRNEALANGCEVPGLGRFDTDDAARLNIAGAVAGAILAKQADQPMEIPWKLYDDSVAVLDADQIIYMGTAVLTYVATCHAVSQGLDAAIEAAEDEASLLAVDIEAGWP